MPVTLPAEESYSDIESLWIATEPGGFFPMGQDSFWGQARKVFCDYMQANLFDKLVTYWNNLDPATVDADDLANYEVMLGIPVDTTKSLDLRRAFVQIRLERGAFTRSRRQRIVEYFIDATKGTPVVFTPDGIPFTSDGIPLYAGEFDAANSYNVVEDIPGFSYDVRIADTIDVDTSGLSRELDRITPAPIEFVVEKVHDPFMDDTGALTVSGNEITDATRAANIQGDGLSNDSSFGIWEATTNLCTNGGFETGTNGWGASGTGTTLVRSTSASKFGSASGLVTVTTAGGTNAGVSCSSIAAVTGETITFSLYVLAASGSPVLDLQVNELDGTGTLVRDTTSTATVTPSASWQRISYTVTLGSSTTQIICYCTLHGVATNASWYIDGVQVEQQPFATPYVHTNGAAATRNAARVQVPASLLGDGTQFWIAFRIRYGWNTADRSGEFPHLFEWRTDNNNRISVAYLPSTSQWEILEMLTGTQAGAQLDAAPAVKNDETTLVFQVTPTQLKGSVDGAAFASAARGGLLAPSGAMFDIGTFAGSGGNVFDGDVLWAACGTGTLTDQDAATLAALGDIEPKYSTLPDTAEITAIIPFDDNNYYVPV